MVLTGWRVTVLVSVCVVFAVGAGYVISVGSGDETTRVAAQAGDVEVVVQSDPGNTNGTIEGRFMPLSGPDGYAEHHFDGPTLDRINWPERPDSQCDTAGSGFEDADGQHYKTLPWLPQSPPQYLEAYGLDSAEFNDRTSPDRSDADNGVYFHLSGDCQSAPTDGGTLSTPNDGVGSGAWLNPHAFGGWTELAAEPSGFTTADAVSTEGTEIDTDQFSGTEYKDLPRMWGTTTRDDTSHAPRIFHMNGYPDYERPEDFILTSSGVSVFRHTFTISEAEWDVLQNDPDAELILDGIADDWMRIYINGEYIHSTHKAIAEVGYESGDLTDLVQQGQNVLAIQAVDKAAWHQGTGSAQKPNAAGLAYELRIEGFSAEEQGAIRGEKIATGEADQSRIDDLEITVEGEGTSTDNPFDFSPVPAGGHTVSTETPSGHSISYTTRTASEECPESEAEAGSSVNVDVPPDSFVYVCFFYHRDESDDGGGEAIIYGANDVRIPRDYYRDNRALDIDVRTYLWPDVGIRAESGFLDPYTEPLFGSGGTERFWLAGIWGEDSNDWRGEGSRHTDPNAMREFNADAEAGCPDGDDCLHRVPMAYVPHRDGDSSTPYPGREDTSRTPDGNNWRRIRQENWGSHSGWEVRSCGTYDNRYNPHCGGRASYLNGFVGGERGNHIKNIEISNIRVRGRNPKALLERGASRLQGELADSVELLQPQAQKINLPTGSQGPDSSPAWDNIRPPSSGLLNGNVGNPQRLTFPNSDSTSDPKNFPDNPANITYQEYENRSLSYGSVDAVTFLQDGQDSANPPYPDKDEPFTYTATLEEVEQVDLLWDEYVDWSQVDDKGHWYTEKTRRATGIDRGDRGDRTTDVNRIEETDNGSREIERRYWRCEISGSYHYHSYSDPDYNPNLDSGHHRDEHYDIHHDSGHSSSHHHDHIWDDGVPCENYYTDYTNYERHCVNNTDVAYTYNDKSYYDDRTRSRYGWYNTQTNKERMPYGKDGETRYSGFYDDYSDQPLWSRFGVTNYWQDAGITSMNDAGSTADPDHDNRWIYDTSDPAYTGRHLYIIRRTPFFRDGYYKYDRDCVYHYPNGSHRKYEEEVKLRPYYPDAEKVYEDTNDWEIDGHVYGKYGNDATFDGRSDGQVDYGWEWRENYQRVRYEHTYPGHHRELGPRFRTVDDEAGGSKYRLRGVRGYEDIRAGRDNSQIRNPTISTSEGDVFAGGALHSYFENSDATNSAFLFSNEAIRNFSGSGRHYPSYYIHDSRDRVDAYYPGSSSSSGEDRVRYLFKNYDELTNRAQSISPRTCDTSDSGPYNFSGSSHSLERGNGRIRDNIWHSAGDVRINATRFTDSAGTIIVEGNLCIDGNITYGGAAGSAREKVPSVGFIVQGNVIVDDEVTELNGSFFSGGQVYTGSKLLNVKSVDGGTGGRVSWEPNDSEREESDQRLTINGLMVANSFSLARQPSGPDNSEPAETFTYDGRVVINPPPGFSRIYTADAVWNDTVPRN